MKRIFLLALVWVLIIGCFAGCGKKPVATEPTEPANFDSKYGISLEDANGVVYESVAQMAVVKTALAYLARNTRIQYDDSRLTGSGTPVMYRWQHGIRLSPEEYTYQSTGYTNCAAFTHDVYLAALGMQIEGYTTKKLTDVGGKQRIYSYYPTGTETDEEKQAVEEEFRANLKMGDLIIIRYNGAKDGNGHAMLYVGSKVLEGVEGYRGTAAEGSESSDAEEDTRFHYDIIHSTGSSYNYGDKAERYEKKGTVQMMSAGSLFDPSTGRYVFGKLKSIVILRPLEVFQKEIPENTLNRLRNMDNIVAEKLSSHPSGHTANPGDKITYTFYITNNNTQEVTLTVEDAVPALATFVEAEKTYPCTVSGDRLQWTVTVPARTTAYVSYDVQVKGDAQPGQSISGDGATVGGVKVPCPDVFVARTLTQQEQSDLLAAVEALSDTKLLRGVDLVNALYSKTLKVEKILPDDLNGILESIYPDLSGVTYINSQSPYAQAIAPGLFGGRTVTQRTMALDNMDQYMRMEAIRTRLPDSEQLIIGDLLILRDGTEDTGKKLYLFTGDALLNLMGDDTLPYEDAQTVLNSVMGYSSFAVLRPSMLLDKQA